MVRVRFAPSPTGYLHLGNIRTALFNYLFARQKSGKFVLRIEDTDELRNMDLGGLKIIEDLNWLGVKYDEGPQTGGPHAPYLQSERKNIYQRNLQELIEQQKVYRCFCSGKELDAKRKRQLALGQPPKYDRACLGMSDDMIKQELVEKRAFIWRLKVNDDAVVEFNTLARGKMTFELKHFGDFALTRSDGTFTFMFTNFVDDWLMEITHVIRGEDHLSNTAMQGALFQAFAITLPTFWHLPMLCNQEGKKLSKRDYGFSLKDLQKEGYLPQAICNYLITVGSTFKEEVQDLEGLTNCFDFERLHSTGSIKYDSEKIKWFNHKWMERLSGEELVKYASPFLKGVEPKKLAYLLDKVKTDLKVLSELPEVLKFYLEEPSVAKEALQKEFGAEKASGVIKLILEVLEGCRQAEVDEVKKRGKEVGFSMREILGTFRYALTGSFRGLGVQDLLDILGKKKVIARVRKLAG